MALETRLKESSVRQRLLTPEVLDDVFRSARSSGKRIDRELLDRELLGEEALLQLFAEALDFPYRADLAGATVPPDFIARVPMHFARRHNVVAVEQRPDAMVVATSSPLDPHPLDDLAMLLNMEVEPVLAPTAAIVALIDHAYKDPGRMDGLLENVIEHLGDDHRAQVIDQPLRAEDLLDVGDKAPVIQLVRQILYEAFRMRASDIHLQPREEDVLVRFRIDGIVYDHLTFPKALQDAVTSRIKVMGYMDIAEKRLPQDGRATMTIRDREIDLRLSSVPTCYGERLVLRLLDKGSRILALEDIGLLPDDLEKVKRIIQYTHGVIFVTGPTGSGKTTTLYAMLNRVNFMEKNVITIEDPIEYRLRGISQIQVTDQKGMTFASGLRSVLRQDPDIIMVGEVRDLDTARIAIQAALTGHLVLSTLHTNDSAGALTRLLDLGIEPYLVSSAMIGVIAQRLVRVICPDCREKIPAEAEAMRELGLTQADLPEGALYRGRGCAACMKTGYWGRSGIYEVLLLDELVRTQIMERRNAGDIKRSLVDRGLRTLRMCGADHAAHGRTTAAEVLRVTQMDAV